MGDTTEDIEDVESLSSQSQTLADVGYSPGRVLRSEARASARARLLSLENSIEKPQQEGGTPGYPSVGSAGHHLGLCTPCDFVYRGSCRTGFACKFCHLCPPQASKNHKKERRKLLRAMMRSQQTDQ